MMGKDVVLKIIKESGEIGVTVSEIAEKTGLSAAWCSALCKKLDKDIYSGVYRKSEPNEVNGKGVQFVYYYGKACAAVIEESEEPKMPAVQLTSTDSAAVKEFKSKLFDQDEAVKAQVDERMSEYKSRICRILDISEKDHVSWLGLFSKIAELKEKADRPGVAPISDNQIAYELEKQRADIYQSCYQDMVTVLKGQPPVIVD